MPRTHCFMGYAPQLLGAALARQLCSCGQMTYCGLEINDEQCEEQMGSLMHPPHLCLVTG